MNENPNSFFDVNQQEFLFQLTIITGTVNNSEPAKVSVNVIIELFYTIRGLLL